VRFRLSKLDSTPLGELPPYLRQLLKSDDFASPDYWLEPFAKGAGTTSPVLVEIWLKIFHGFYHNEKVRQPKHCQ